MEERDSAAVQSRAFSPRSHHPRVMVVSSVLLYREGLEASLSADNRLQVVAVTSPANVFQEMVRFSPDAILLDATGDEALAMAKRLKAIDQKLVLVGFGISSSTTCAVACAEAGLASFIDQNGTIDELVQTTINALRGEFDCSPRVTAILIERLAKLANGDAVRDRTENSLTPREREIASLVSEGLSNKEIALDLRIGPATVKNHVHNILDKLGVRRRAAIAARVSDLLE